MLGSLTFVLFFNLMDGGRNLEVKKVGTILEETRKNVKKDTVCPIHVCPRFDLEWRIGVTQYNF